MADFDLAIIGGGINGTGIARDAAGRGLRVLLVEQNDLAAGTSSASTKLIHGGLRYLEHGAIRLVRESLAERERLLRLAPHIIRPLRIVLPAYPGPRSAWLVRLGLFLYDRLGGRKILPPTRTVDLTHNPVGAALKRRFRYGFEYSDCWVDDARLVVLNALDAAERGAVIRTRTKVTRAEREGEWRLILNEQGRRDVATARVLVNAAGPWVGVVAETILRLPGRPPVRLVKGSHIVVRKLFDHDRGYIFQNADKRVVFALPFAGDFTLIGTTDEDFSGELDGMAPSAQEVIYLCQAASEYFREPIGPEHVVWTFAGVRSLHDDGAGKPEDVTRDYHLTLDEKFRQAPVLTVYGGKITTYRRLAEAAVGRLSHFFQGRPPWTAEVPLPGGDFPWDALETLVTDARQAWPFLSEDEARRLVRAYGTRLNRVLGEATSRDALGPRFGELTAAEVRYLMAYEWARTADDVLWRRTKLGLRLTADEKAALTAFMESAAAQASATASTSILKP
jgi:glycerol-3-phosphate dehydrogenase